MGELKQIREQQDNLIRRAKTWSDKLYSAGLGAYSKTTEGSEALYGRYVDIGQEAYGDDAQGKPRPRLAGHGLVVSARKLIQEAPRKRHELYERCVTSGKQERGDDARQTNEFVLAGAGAISMLREQGQKLFDDLVSAGEKERA